MVFLFSLFLSLAQAQENQARPYFKSFGDSITAGMGIDLKDRYTTLLAQDLKLDVQNLAVSGQTACQMSEHQVFKPDTRSTPPLFKTLMIGTNDSNAEGVGDYETVYSKCMMASLTWLAMPENDKFCRGGQTVCQFQSTGSPVYIWFQQGDDLNSQFIFNIDNTQNLRVDTKATPQIKTRDGRGLRGQGVIRLTNIPAGPHTITLKVLPNGSTPVTIYGVGSLRSKSEQTQLYVAGVPYQRFDKKSAASAKYNERVKNIVLGLQNEGLPVKFIDIRNFLGFSKAEFYDDLHPTIDGNIKIYQAFRDGIN